MDGQWCQLAQWIVQSNRIVFFGSAGISTESGTPDFRGVEGFFHQDHGIPVERVLFIGFFEIHPQVCWEQFAQENVCEGVASDVTHRFLMELEKRGSPSTVITRNIDGLHQSTGSKRIFELHGNQSRLLCVGCGRHFSIADFGETRTGAVPRCPSCTYVVRPDIVSYGKIFNSGVLEGAVQAITDVDVLIVAGTSLVVYPVAGLVDYYDGNRLMLMNVTSTPYDSRANLVIRNPVGKASAKLARAV